ncbi:hypothetical protein SAMN05518801_102349 [Novosphingobium sp. CF614]|uniref:nucleotidyltransferase family protein n=1 Tax=Novosphingobium sp. CF614 TaxID=1884364 RepID=UPI0008E21C83|nr:nucleotidyltransferase family protein [Novosphingobium sp. CF614]SFF87214.1 hypothetical protein SAMN05518801_102349 [Novosphingobium sp. CF614]
MSEAAGAEKVARWIRNDPLRWNLLGHVRALDLPDCQIAAGFVRDAVWAILHDQSPDLAGDVDVIWFDATNTAEETDRSIEARLRAEVPNIRWSVKNQARMHIDNGDAPYRSSEDAMRFWPETATAVAARRTQDDRCEVIAPFGVSDLLTLTLRPAGDFKDRKRAIFEQRVEAKNWLTRLPRLLLTG